MPRKPRHRTPDHPHHVVNRRNDRRIMFRDRVDYATFIEMMDEASRRTPVRLFGYCLMPNHFHLVVRPDTETALSAYMERLTGRYACYFRCATDTVGHGHVVKRRFWNAPIYGDAAALLTLRYVEANPVRARLVGRAEDWEWSSLADRNGLARGILSPLPFEIPANWSSFVNTPMSDDTLIQIRKQLVPMPGHPRSRARYAGEPPEEFEVVPPRPQRLDLWKTPSVER